jgi:hypothetical protein
MDKSQINPMPAYFDRYINLAENETIIKALETSKQELDDFPIERWAKVGDKVYAEGKWTIKQIFQHMIDTERVFTYRALCFARGETAQLPSFDENSYADNADVTHRNLVEIIEEFKIVKANTISLFRSFTDEMLLKNGIASSSTYSVLAAGFIIAGHQRWHFRVIEERYSSI